MDKTNPRYIEVREKIAYKLWLLGCPDTELTKQGWTEIWNRPYWLEQADQILSISGIVILDEDQSLPDVTRKNISELGQIAQQDMLKAGFRRIK
jgi:hypothetical protein